MIYDFMRVILFFDLPMITKTDKRVYNRFRKWLIENGYLMMQFSIYCKIFANRDSVKVHIEKLKKNVPKRGQIRVMTITEKQYTNIVLLIGDITRQEELSSPEGFLEL